MKPSKRDILNLNHILEQDYSGAVTAHETRMTRFARYYQKWRNRVDPPAGGDEDKPNFSVPLLQWQVFAKWATALDSLLGDDAEITAVPVGPVDHRIVHKVGRFMQWRVFSSMQILDPLAIFLFRQILYGRAHAFSRWEVKSFQTPTGRQVYYEGPGFDPMAPSDLIIPGEDCQSIQDFSFVIRRTFLTPQDLLIGEENGTYSGIRENWENIVDLAKETPDRQDQEEKAEQDEAEGVDRETALYNGSMVEVHQWYGRYRPVKGGRPSFDEHELVAYRIPALHLMIGSEDLMELYPNIPRRRPFVEGAMVRDGSYWSPGFGELLESIEDETTNNHRLFTQAQQFAVGPLIFYKPGSGFDPEAFEYEPNKAIPSEEPQAVNIVQLRGDLQSAVIKEQAVIGYGEKVTGVSEQTLGRAIDRPNAPRTAAGQIALLEQGNIRASLDVKFLRESMRKMLKHFWSLETQYPQEQLFFRVTEEEAKGIFPTRQGGAVMTAAEMVGEYDFSVRFATSPWDREARRQRQLSLYQLDLGNPLIAQNPVALYKITADVHREMGDPNFQDIIPEPPELDMPKNPRDEWARMLQGEPVDIHPGDHDTNHIAVHTEQLMRIAQSRPEDRDPTAERALQIHLRQHEQQRRQKMLMQQMAQSLVQSMGGQPGAEPMAPEVAGMVEQFEQAGGQQAQ